MNFNGKKILAKPNGNTYDIIEALVKITPQSIKQVKPKINELINVTGDAYKDALEIAAYIRKNITYKADGYKNQNIQLPGRILKDTKVGDCKSFSLLFCSMMIAAGHKAGYRFASYRSNKIPTHVYNWILYKNNLLTFDTCVPTLKESPRHTYTKDMDVNYLTGYPDNDYINGKAEREARRAKRKAKRKEGKGFFSGVKKIALAAPRNAFRALVALNVRGLAKRLDLAIKKDSNKVKEFWTKFGGAFDKLQQSINTGKNKKALLGEKKGVTGYYDYDSINGDFEPYIGIAIEAAIASASAILIPAVKLLKDLGIKKEEGEEIITEEEEAEAEASGTKLKDPNFESVDAEPGSEPVKTTTEAGFKISPLVVGAVLGGGILIYLLTKKKK